MSQFADQDPVTQAPRTSGTLATEINPGAQFQESDDVYTLNGFNVISRDDPDYAGKASRAT